jgi:hypothetical protein
LANGALFGAAEIPQVTEALLKFGAVANTANVSLEESTGLIEALAEKGLKGAEAGTALRNVMLKLSAPNALPKEAQQRLEALGISFADLQDTSKPFSERLEALKPLLNDNAALVKVFGTENAVAATNLIANTDRIADLTEKMYTQGTASKQAEDRTQTLAHALTQLRGAWEEVILGFMNGSGASQVLVQGIQFLAANLGTIISIVGKLVVAWGAYKALQVSLQVIEKARAFSFAEFGKQIAAQIPMTRAYRLEQANAARAAQQSGQAAQAAGKSMMAVPWMAIVGLVIELGMAFWDAAKGTAAFEAAQKKLDKTLEASNTFANERSQNRQNELSKRLTQLQRERNEGKISETAFLKQKANEIAATRAQIKADIEAVQARNKQRIEQIKQLEVDAKYTGNVGETVGKIKSLRIEVMGANEKIALYRKELDTTTESQKDATSEVNANSEAQEDNTNKINAKIPKQKEQKITVEAIAAAFRKQREELTLLNEVERLSMDPEDVKAKMLLDEQRAVGAADISVLEAEIALKRLEGTKDTKALAKAEEDLRKAREAQILAQLKLDLAQTDDVNEQDRLRKEAELKILNLGKKEVEIVKMTAEQRNEWVKFATDYFIQKSNERIAQLDKEIAAAEKQQDTLRELAANGNINARESLAENQRIIDEANRKKEQQERRKQMIELVSGVYQTYNQKVAANAKNPLMETIRDTVLLQQFANTLLGNMPTFFDGTENTGKHGEGVDGKGGFHAILHPNERVVPKSLNEKIGSLSNEQLAKVAQEYQNGKLITGTQPMSAIDLSLLVNKMDELTHTIRNKPETNIELGEITSSVMEIVKTTKQGNTLKTNRFKIRK